MKARELIEKELKKDGMSQTLLARKMNLSQATIHKILHTATAHTVKTQKEIATYFRIPFSSLFDETPSPPAAASSPDAEYWKNKYLASLEELNDARKKIDRLTSRPAGADLQGVGSKKKAM